jgi:cation:H+ antiporter
MPLYVNCLLIAASIPVLWKSADWFVEGAVGTARKLKVPEMLVGLVLVSIATTAPELTASLLAALQGNPEMAVGNAVGSVVLDDTMALGLAAVLAPVPLVVNPRVFRTSAIFLALVCALAFLMVTDGTLSRPEGGCLAALFAGYAILSIVLARRRARSRAPAEAEAEAGEAETGEGVAPVRERSGKAIVGLFVLGLAGVLIGSELLVVGARGIAEQMKISPAVIGLTVVAIGTSIPEIATAIASALKGHSGIGIGNILGADILNICWVAGLSAVANPMTIGKRTVYAMFPSMLVVVATMLILLRMGYRLSRWKGCVLVGLYVAYVILLLYLVPPGAQG